MGLIDVKIFGEEGEKEGYTEEKRIKIKVFFNNGKVKFRGDLDEVKKVRGFF